MPAPAHELMALHAHTLFVHDGEERLLTINDTLRRPAARVFVGWTTDGVIGRVRHDLPASLAARMAELIAAEAAPADLTQTPRCLPEIRALLADLGPLTERGGPEYVCPVRFAASTGDLTGTYGAVDVTAVTGANANVFARWLPDWIPDATTGLPLMATLVDGDAVAVCGCARVPGRATHAGVETHVEYRRRGYVTLATAAWMRVIRDRGIIPLYGTSWSNVASQRVAARLGLVQYGASISID